MPSGSLSAQLRQWQIAGLCRYNGILFVDVWWMMKVQIVALVLSLAVCGVLRAENAPLPDYAPVSHGQHVVINIPQLRLFLFEDGRLKRVFPIAVGRDRTRTPVGEYRIGAKAFNPTWTIPASIRRERAAAGLPDLRSVPPGPSNPLGPVFVRFGHPSLGLGIHGTNVPSSVPGVRSHGCVRMRSENALQFARTVHTGAHVAVIYQMASLNVDEGGNLWLAAYKDPYRQRNLDRDALKQSIQAWADENGDRTVHQARVNKALREQTGRLVCLTCATENGRLSGQLTSLSWQEGSAYLRTANSTSAAETPAADEVLPEGSSVEAMSDSGVGDIPQGVVLDPILEVPLNPVPNR